MSDYTPTTEEVRSEYVEYCDAPDCHKHQYAGLAFDRWLASVKAEAMETGYNLGFVDGMKQSQSDATIAERERILIILEHRARDLEACGKQDDCKEMAMIVRVCMSDIQEVTE